MDFLSILAALKSDGIGLLRALNALSVEEAASLSGNTRSKIRHYRWVWGFFSDQEVQAEAETAQLSLGVAEILARALNQGDKNRDKKADMIELCRLVAGLDADSARATAIEQVRAWKQTQESDKADFAHMHAEVEADGKRRLVARLRDDRASEVHRVLHGIAKSVMKAADGQMPYAVAYAEALCYKILSPYVPKEKSNEVASAPAEISTTEQLTSAFAPSGALAEHTPLFAPLFVIPTDCQYFADGRIATAAGGLVDLADLVNEPLKDTGYAAVMGKDENDVPSVIQLLPVKYKDKVAKERFATPAIRLVATLETLKCSRPGCNRAAAVCEMHHINSWASGGETSTSNITALCSTDNGLNDDKPGKPPKHGRIERDLTTGRPGLRRHPDAPLEFNQHPLVKKGTRTLGEHFYR